MPSQPFTQRYDVAVIGSGPAGVAAALAAAQNGAHTLLVEASPYLGGGLVSGLPIDGGLNALGEWIVGGPARELFAACEALDGYIGPVCDWRTLYGVCVDPQALRIAIVQALERRGVTGLLSTLATRVVREGRRIAAVELVSKGQSSLVSAAVWVDGSGDGDIAALAGAAYEQGGVGGVYQPVSMVYRLCNVDFAGYLAFVRDHPDEFLLGENPIYGKTRAECAQALYQAGYPFVALSAQGTLLGAAIRSGEMFPCAAIFVTPTSLARREVGINATRIANVDATDAGELSRLQPPLVEQVTTNMRFMQRRVPGFGAAHLAGVAPQLGVRETRRIVGEYVLTAEDVLAGRKCADGIAKGAHHIDLHGGGTDQQRIPIPGGRSYDIPYGCLIPRGLDNLLVAGRCLSSTREANGSARVMGTCLATGQAAGTAAALCVTGPHADVRALPIAALRATLMAQGAVLEGTQ